MSDFKLVGLNISEKSPRCSSVWLRHKLNAGCCPEACCFCGTKSRFLRNIGPDLVWRSQHR